MTIEEVIRELEQIRDGAEVVLASGFGQREGEHDLVYRRRFDFANTAIELVEKQIAKRPIGMSISHEGRLGNCPCCKKLVHELYDIVGCSECLQRLNWGKENGNK